MYILKLQLETCVKSFLISYLSKHLKNGQNGVLKIATLTPSVDFFFPNKIQIDICVFKKRSTAEVGIQLVTLLIAV